MGKQRRPGERPGTRLIGHMTGLLEQRVEKDRDFSVSLVTLIGFSGRKGTSIH